MLYLLSQFGDQIPVLNVFRYITFRTGGAMLTALVFVFLFGPRIIAALRIRQGKGQPIRADGPQTHLVTKVGTPTMGGLMILSGCWSRRCCGPTSRNGYVWIVLLVTLGFGLIGFYDDYLKVTKQTHKGFSGKLRLRHRGLIAIVACYFDRPDRPGRRCRRRWPSRSSRT
jgi:phospho-N-acetylmuramoyl-pentapeptide-transferase